MSGKDDGGMYRCDVSDCDRPALARVFPTAGETNHSALRCQTCLEEDLDTGHFADWAEAIRTEGTA